MRQQSRSRAPPTPWRELSVLNLPAEKKTADICFMFPRLEATAAQVEPEAKPLCCQKAEAVPSRPSSLLLKTKVFREHIQFQSKQNQLASTA